MTYAKSLLIGLVLSCVHLTAYAQHEADMLIGSTEDRGGALSLAYDFGQDVVVTLAFTGAGISLFTGTAPGFDAQTMPNSTRPIYPLRNNTAVTVQIVSLDPGVSMKVKDTIIDAPGESATIGNAPSLHLHPQWRLTLSEDVHGRFPVAFKLTTSSRNYTESTVYQATLTNLAGFPTATPTASSTLSAMPTATMTVTPTVTAIPSRTTSPTTIATLTPTLSPQPTSTCTASPTPSASTTPGRGSRDSNCDGRVSAADLPRVILRLGDSTGSCSADANGDGSIDSLDLAAVVTAVFGMK